jgi:hypothetical protein
MQRIVLFCKETEPILMLLFANGILDCLNLSGDEKELNKEVMVVMTNWRTINFGL